MSVTAEALAAQGWTIKEDYQPKDLGTCRGCGARILWCETPAGKSAPMNRDGTNHFIDCPKRDQFRTKPK